MKIGGQTNFILINQQASSLHSLIADGKYRSTSLGRNAWRSLVSGSSFQPNCNKEGFNIVSDRGSGWSEARIGILGNNENDCQTADSYVGFGTGAHPYNSNTCGNAARWGGDKGDKNIKAMGYIFVSGKLEVQYLSVLILDFTDFSNSLPSCKSFGFY